MRLQPCSHCEALDRSDESEESEAVHEFGCPRVAVSAAVAAERARCERAIRRWTDGRAHIDHAYIDRAVEDIRSGAAPAAPELDPGAGR